MAQALVALKDLVQAKTRLAGMLRPSERRALAQAMVEDVLTVLAAHPAIARVSLVSDDPAAGMLAEQYGACHIAEQELGCHGLNAVIAGASEHLLGSAEMPLLVLHADLPLLAADDISAVLATWRDTAGLVIGCDRHGSGTNLLCFDRRCAPDFRFGEDSCKRHTDAAAAKGITTTVISRPGVGLDVDEPTDLALLLDQLKGGDSGHTAALLGGTDLGARIRMALASLVAPANSTGQSEVG